MLNQVCDRVSDAARALRRERNRRYYLRNCERLRVLARERKSRLKPSETGLDASETRLKPSETGEKLPSPPLVPPPSPRTPNPPPFIPPQPTKLSGSEIVLQEAEKRPPGRRGCRLPSSWSPTVEHRQIGAVEGLTDLGFERATVQFRDHWASAAGGRSRKLDWDAAFRNWLRTAGDRLAAGQRRPVRVSRSALDVGGGVAVDQSARIEAHRAAYLARLAAGETDLRDPRSSRALVR